MFRDLLIEESADDLNCLGVDMDDYDLRVAWVPRRTPRPTAEEAHDA